MNEPEATRVVLAALPPGGAAWAIGAAVAVLVLSAYGLRRLSPRRRLTLLALRAVGIACALVLLFQPTLRRERRALRPSRVAVLLDASASMALPLSGNSGPSRFDRARALAKDAAAFADASLVRTVELYTFGTSKDGAPIALPPAALDSAHATGSRTAIAEALTALPRGIDRDLAAAIVISDGADHGRAATLPLDEATREALHNLDAPVHTIAVGDAQVRDIVVGRVAHDDFAFVRTPITFDVPVEALGAEAAGWIGKSVPVVLRRDGAVVATESVTLGRDVQHVSLKHVPERVGEFVFDVSIAPQPGELTAANNIQRIALRVVRDRVRVLQVSGRPSWDERFLRSLFKRDPNVDLISFFILRTPNAIEIASTDELSLIPFPTDELFRESLRTFDLVVLQNFDYGPYQMEPYLPLIRKYVEEGGALAMLGGELSFDAGDYAGTPIEAILPVELGVPKANRIDTKSVSPRLTAAGRQHPLTALALDVEESARRFAALPAFDGINRVRRARPEATVLAEHPTLLDADGKPMPIISVREAGKGRVLAVGSDSTWRWAFDANQNGTDRPYEHFWESAVRWLVRDPALSLLRLEVDHGDGHGDGSTISGRVTAVGPDYHAVEGVEVQLSVERIADPSGLGHDARTLEAPPVGRTDAKGVFEFTLAAMGEGAYRLRARATLGGREASDERVFLVEGNADEVADPAVHARVLEAIAKATGGETRAASAGLTGLALRPPRETRVAASEDRALWASPFVLFLGVLALVAAWGLGRRWGRR